MKDYGPKLPAAAEKASLGTRMRSALPGGAAYSPMGTRLMKAAAEKAIGLVDTKMLG